MIRSFLIIFVAGILFLESAAYCGESADNRAKKTWSFEGTTGYRPYYVREYSLGLTRFDNLSASRGGARLILSRLWTNRAYIGRQNTWKLDGHSLAGGYRQFFGNSFFAEANLLVEIFRAWAPAYSGFDAVYAAEDFGNSHRWAITIQAGNQWQWENLNFGITWLGAILPLSHKFDIKGRNESFQSYLTETTNLGIRFSLGWAI